MARNSTSGRLAKLDLSLRLSHEEEQTRLGDAQRRLLALRLQLAGKLGDGHLGPPVCVLLEGWDASGKGGAIKRLVASLDPRHVRVATFGAPTPDEKRHQYLLRFAPALRAGAGWRCSTAHGTDACWSSGSRASQVPTSGLVPTTRSSGSSAYALATGWSS